MDKLTRLLINALSSLNEENSFISIIYDGDTYAFSYLTFDTADSIRVIEKDKDPQPGDQEAFIEFNADLMLDLQIDLVKMFIKY